MISVKSIESITKIRIPAQSLSLSNTMEIHMKCHENQGIIAIGGTSKHYKFDVNTMINQLHYILSTHPKYEFQIYNSRRTPEAANQKILNELNGYNNADFIDINNPKSQFFETTNFLDS